MTFRQFIGVAFGIGIVFLIARLQDCGYRGSHASQTFQPAPRDQAGSGLDHSECVLVIDQKQAGSGRSFADLAPGGSTLTLLKAVGAMVLDSLVEQASCHFAHVRVADQPPSPHTPWVLVTVLECQLLDDLEHTNWRVRGLPFLLARMDLHAAVKLRIKIQAPGQRPHIIEVVGRSKPPGRLRLFALMRFRRDMTECIESAARNACSQAWDEALASLAKQAASETARSSAHMEPSASQEDLRERLNEHLRREEAAANLQAR